MERKKSRKKVRKKSNRQVEDKRQADDNPAKASCCDIMLPLRTMPILALLFAMSLRKVRNVNTIRGDSSDI